MRFPQVLIYESDGRLAKFLRREAKARAWSIREPRGLESSLRLLRRGGPSVLVLKLGKDLLREFTLLERVVWLFPDTATVVVTDADDPQLADLAWDLGASYVLLVPQSVQELVEIVAGFVKVQHLGPSTVPAENGTAEGELPAS